MRKLIYTGEDFPEDRDGVVYIAARVSGVWYRRKTKWTAFAYGPYEFLNEWER